MDLVAGAKLLADLIGERDAPPVERPQLADATPIFRWLGVQPPSAKQEDE